MDAIEELNTVTESNMILEEIEKVSRKVKENAGKERGFGSMYMRLRALIITIIIFLYSCRASPPGH